MTKQFFERNDRYLFPLFLFIALAYYSSKLNYYLIPNSDFFLYLSEGKALLTNPFFVPLSPPLYSVIVSALEAALPFRHAGEYGGILINNVCFILTLYLMGRMLRTWLGFPYYYLPILLIAFNPLMLGVNWQPNNSALFLTLIVLTIAIHRKHPTISYICMVLAYFCRYEAIILIPVLVLWDLLERKRIVRPIALALCLLPIAGWIYRTSATGNQYFDEISARKHEVPNILYLKNSFTVTPFYVPTNYYAGLARSLSPAVLTLTAIVIVWIFIGAVRAYRDRQWELVAAFSILILYSVLHVLFPDANLRYSYPALPFVYMFYFWPLVYMKRPEPAVRVIVLAIVCDIFFSMVVNQYAHQEFLTQERWIKSEKRFAAEWLNGNIKRPVTVYAFEYFVEAYYNTNKLVTYATDYRQKEFQASLCDSKQGIVIVVDNQVEEPGYYFDYVNNLGFFKDFVKSSDIADFRMIWDYKRDDRWAKIYQQVRRPAYCSLNYPLPT
jgi:hypothetical protein